MSDDLLPLRLCENLRTPGYVPFYLALAGGFWRDAGLDVEHVLSPSTPQTASALLDGSVDVSWGGPMRVMMHHDADPQCPLVCFAQVVARDPFVLVGRTVNPRFRFDDLLGLRVAVASDVPTPWMTMQDDLQRAGIAPAQIDRRPDQPMADNVAAFERGEVDVVQVFEPWVDRLVESGAGHVWHRFSDRGDIAYTTFYATRRFVQERREVCRRLVRGHRERAVGAARALGRGDRAGDRAVLSRPGVRRAGTHHRQLSPRRYLGGNPGAAAGGLPAPQGGAGVGRPDNVRSAL